MAEVTLVPQIIVSGILMGFIFSLTAVGLTLIYGVMDIVNFAHGEFLMLGMYLAYWIYIWIGLDPIISLPICTLVLFLIGVATHKLIVSRVLHAAVLAQVLATFGVMVFIRSAAQFLWTPNYRLIQQPLLTGRLEFFGIFIGVPHLVAALGALLITGFVYYLIERTEVGRALQAVSEDREAASLMGINSDRIYALAWGISAASMGAGGALLSSYYYIFPDVGEVFTPIAFVTVALGGFGSVSGAFLAGLIIGVVQVLGGFYVGPAYKNVVIFALYMIVILVRPQGLLGEW